MATNALNYPHPVLDWAGKDFPDCSFGLSLESQDDSGDSLVFRLNCTLDCPGMASLVSDGLARAIVRIVCKTTSYRDIRSIPINEESEISIAKQSLANSLELQAMIVSCVDMDQYCLLDFNQAYFERTSFRLRKGDVLAIEPGLSVKLNSVLEKDMAGIVQVSLDSNAPSLRVHYAALEDMEADRTDYIYVQLPESEYYLYGKLRTKKHLKNGVERFLQGCVILPAIVGALALLRLEELQDDDDIERHYKGTVWADSLYSALKKLGIDSLAEEVASDYELANKVLGDVVGDSMGNLMQKLNEWSTIRDEGDF